MNRKRREILAAMEPAVQLAMSRAESARRDVPGLALHARPTASAPAELMIYGRIGGGSWFESGITAADVAALLKEAGPGPINVRINSGGGDAFDGVAIHSLLARHPGVVHTFNDALAASAASVILMAGDKVTSAKGAMTMIHDAMTGPYGNAATLRRAADLCETLSDVIADLYADRAGEDREHWRTKMTENAEDGTWFTGAQALEAGLVDFITEPQDEDDDTVLNRLAGWVGDLPEPLRAQMMARLPDEPEPLDEPVAPVTEDGEGAALAAGNEDDDYAYRMSMWLATHGRTA